MLHGDMYSFLAVTANYEMAKVVTTYQLWLTIPLRCRHALGSAGAKRCLPLFMCWSPVGADVHRWVTGVHRLVAALAPVCSKALQDLETTVAATQYIENKHALDSLLQCTYIQGYARKAQSSMSNGPESCTFHDHPW